MRSAMLAACTAIVLSATGLAALTSGRAVPQFPGAPARAHVALGPVRVLARPEPDAAPVPLAAAARARYGRIDALAQVRVEALPWSDAALVTGVAIVWD